MKHFKKTIVVAALALLVLPLKAQITLDECQRLARENYPLLKRYDLIRRTTDYTLSNLNKGYLPQLTFGAQATLQSDVMTLPDMLTELLRSNGYNPEGLKKDQYKVQLELNQIIYDGGNIRAGKDVARLDGEVRNRQNDVDMYAIRDRVNNLFFGILLLDDKLRLNDDLQTLLLDNQRKLEAMRRNGTAMQSDVNAVKAEYLCAKRQETELMSVRESYRNMLAVFIGRKVYDVLAKPVPSLPFSKETLRPELLMYDTQIRQTRARINQVNAGLRPTLSLFAQGYYGYPGYNMFDDMFSRDFSLNGMVGVRLSWNIGRFYTSRNDRRKLSTAIDELENRREVFLFNNRLQSTEDAAAIDKYRKMMKEDDEIISLRTAVRRSAEAKLEHGIIDVNDLLQEIIREHNARTDLSTHETEMLKSIYELKNTLNQ